MIFLHHYPASLFSEKIRLLLGHYDLAWQSVEISSIMPRPLLMPLSGGYRRTPVLQIGANIYADTKVISAALARHVGDDELYSGGFLAHRTADWGRLAALSRGCRIELSARGDGDDDGAIF